MRYLICLFTALTPFYIQSQERIENGTPVSAQNSLSRSIALMRSPRGICSASFIHQRYLLTASHCTYRAKVPDVEILVRDKNNTLYAARVARLLTHPQFKMQKTSQGTKVFHDIALIELADTFPFPINVLRIGNVNEFMNEEKTVVVAGYGKNGVYGGSGELRQGRMVARAEILPLFYDRIGLSMVPETNQALCSGDSGGAVLNRLNGRNYLVGVNSLSNGCYNSDDTKSKAEIISQNIAWLRKYVPGI
jgi:secreted trypsin-like serine protease